MEVHVYRPKQMHHLAVVVQKHFSLVTQLVVEPIQLNHMPQLVQHFPEDELNKQLRTLTSTGFFQLAAASCAPCSLIDPTLFESAVPGFPESTPKGGAPRWWYKVGTSVVRS